MAKKENIFIPEFLTEYNWSIVFQGDKQYKDIYLDTLLSQKLDIITTRIKLENDKLSVYYAIPKYLPVQDMELSSTTLMKLLISDCIRKISIHVKNNQDEDQFIISNSIMYKKPTYEMVFGSIQNNTLQLIVHYDVFNQEII